MTEVTINTKDDEQMSSLAKQMWYTKEEFKTVLEVLNFLNKCGFDLIPQYITDMILDKISKNKFVIPWLKLNPNNIDIKKGNFWEFEEKIWLSVEAKINIVKFVNKALSWYIDVPLDINNYARWNEHIEKDKFINFCYERWLIIDKEKDLWEQHKIIKNLKNNTINYNKWTKN